MNFILGLKECMVILKKDKVFYCDIDDTLIKFGPVPFLYGGRTVFITCDGLEKEYAVINGNITAIKEHKQRGHGVIIWTKSTYLWAEAVIKALQLENYVDMIICKPEWIADDKSPTDWMPEAKFYDNNEELKSSFMGG